MWKKYFECIVVHSLGEKNYLSRLFLCLCSIHKNTIVVPMSHEKPHIFKHQQPGSVSTASVVCSKDFAIPDYGARHVLVSPDGPKLFVRL